MGRLSMENIFRLAVCLSVTLCAVTGLRCYECTDVVLDTSNVMVNTAFRTLTGNSAYCNISVDESTPGIKIENCPPPQFGNVAKCGYTKGRGGLSFTFFNFGAKYYGRECVEEAIGSPDICKANNNEDKNLFSDFIKVIGFDVVSYEGTRCTCSTDLCNSQPKITAVRLCWMAALLVAVWGNLQ